MKKKQFICTVQERGQVTLPLELRKKLGIEKGQRVRIFAKGDSIVIEVIRRTLLDSLGKLKLID